MTQSNKPGETLNVEIALAHVEGDRQLLAELSAMFLRDYPRLLEEARNAILQDDSSGLERAAHTLKGRLAFFGVHKAQAHVLKLEMMGRTSDLAHARQALEDIEAELESVLPEFESLSEEQHP